MSKPGKRLNPLLLDPSKRVSRPPRHKRTSGPSEPAILRHDTPAHTNRTRPARLPRSNADHELVKQADRLKAHIERELKHASNLVSQGRFDQAGKVAAIVTHSRARLVRVLADIEAMPVDPALPPVNFTPKTRTAIKPKRYGRWSDNPKPKAR